MPLLLLLFLQQIFIEIDTYIGLDTVLGTEGIAMENVTKSPWPHGVSFYYGDNY